MRFSFPYIWYRLMGITTLFLMGYIVVVGIFGRVDVSAYLPINFATTVQQAWPQMPFFAVEREPVDGGKGEIIYYTVPTHQFTAQELARLEGTNRTVHPAAPK
jgi:hypothetical protein